MVTFELPPESHALITGETGRTIHRHHGLTIRAALASATPPGPTIR
jgi:hypothetical protein